MQIEIIYQDNEIVVVNKPSGLLVHKSWLAKQETTFALQEVRNLTGKHVFPVHRLDKPTSGVLIFAFSGEMAAVIQAEWESIEKTYWAVCRGWLKEDVLVDHPLKGMTDYGQSEDEAQEAQTWVETLQTAEIEAAIDKYPQSRFSLLKVIPKQGRTHQIRRHLKHLSHPIIGDSRYGKGKYNRYIAEHFGADRLLLHAKQFTMKHPVSGKSLTFEAEIDDKMMKLFTHFKWQV